MRPEFRKFLLAGAATALLACASTASAQATDPIAFNIPSQPLGAALAEFARQSNVDVLVSSQLARNQQSPALQGEMPAPQALAMLLSGTPLTYRATSNGSFVIEAAADPQSSGAAGDGAEVEALIVTAQKREEDIQDVPIAISAFSQESLERSQIAGGPDLITQVPNMTFTKTNFSSYSIQLRGIGTQAISATTDAAVAVAFNNTPFIRNRFFEQEFYDLQRVEVLRGPQGTLYGRNATAGVVNIISAKPKFVAEGKLSGDVSNYNSTRLEGMVNIPLVEDKVALRLAGAWTKREGYATNELTGNPIDGRDLWSTRLSLRFAPTDRLDANLIWEHFQEDDDRLRSGKQLCKKHVVSQIGDITDIPFAAGLPNAGQAGARWAAVQPTFSQGCERVSLYSPEAFQTPNGASVPYYVALGGLGLPTALFDPYVRLYQSRDLRMIESTIDPKYRAMADLGEFQISFDINDDLTLTAETAYSSDFVYSQQDFNRFNTAPGAWLVNPNYVATGALDEQGVFCDPQLGCTDRLIAVDLSTAKSRQFSQELRLSSDFEGPFNFSLGANFLRFDGEDKYYVFINSLTLAATNSYGSFESVPYLPGISDNSECLRTGLKPGDPTKGSYYSCIYIEPNSIENIQDQGHNYFLSKNPYKLISYAIFGEAYYNITDALKVTAGLRWTVDKKEAPRIPSWTFGGNSVGYPVADVTEQEWREPTGRLAIDWKPRLSFTDETLLYASYAHGYKAGGANPPPMTEVGISARAYGSIPVSETRPRTFDPEFLDSFELGAKNTFADGKLTLNMAAFYYDYTGYQISEIVDRSAFNRNFDATIWGVEAEADWKPTENLKFGLKGGYEKTRIADGESAIDLMDRTAGHDDWVVVRPFPTFASSCILPTWLFVHDGLDLGRGFTPGLYGLGAVGGGSGGGCELAYLAGNDPVTNAPYIDLSNWTAADGPIPEGGGSTLFFWNPPGTPGAYPGWDPKTAPNNGEGFAKQLGGNELPNAPNWTATITADYTLPLSHDWLATLHTDLHWQSESWWRVFNDHEFDKLDEYFTMNLAAIFTNEEAGWKVMAYVKNVTDETAITGAFLNSDDTGLTTNVFLTEPRLYGIRVTKDWTGGPLLGAFGARHDGPYALTVELGGQVQRHDAPYQTLAPSFIDQFPASLSPLGVQNRDLDWGDGRSLKITWRPNGPWSMSASVRRGETNSSTARAHLEETGDSGCRWSETSFLYGLCAKYPDNTGYVLTATNWSDGSASNREEHHFVDFAAGYDVGLGRGWRSLVSAGLRYAQFDSTTKFSMDGVPDWDIPNGWGDSKYGAIPASTTHHRYKTSVEAQRTFEGAGPVLSWEASKVLLGSDEPGHLDIDWAIAAGVLFGKQKTSIKGQELFGYFNGNYYGVGFGQVRLPIYDDPTPVNVRRNTSVTAPIADLSLGLSYEIDRLKVSAGYKWERYFDVLDVGANEHRDADRTIDGPYFKLAIGFGG